MHIRKLAAIAFAVGSIVQVWAEPEDAPVGGLWTSEMLRGHINKALKNTKLHRYEAAIELGERYSAGNPSTSFVRAAIRLLRDRDPIVRAVALTSLNSKTVDPKEVAQFLQGSIGDPEVQNRQIAINILATIDPLASSTIQKLIERAYLDTDRETRDLAHKRLKALIGSINKRTMPEVRPALIAGLPMLDRLREIGDDADRQSAGALAADFRSLVDAAEPKVVRQGAWESSVEFVRSNFVYLLAIEMAIAVTTILVVQVYYLILFWLAPVKLYSFAHSALPAFVIPYLLAPTGYRDAHRLIVAVINRFARDLEPAEGEQMRLLVERLSQTTESRAAELVVPLTAAIQKASDAKAREFHRLLKAIAPAEAVKVMHLLPNDPEIIMAREQMASILQTPQGTHTQRGLTLEHQLNQATTISGDFYNLIPRGDGGLSIYMVDVIGHGLPAALLALQIYVVLKTAEPQWGMGRPKQELGAADDLMRRLAGEFAVCMSFLEIEVTSGIARYASAGMPPALLFRSGETLPVELKAAGTYIGEGYKFSDVRPDQAEHSIRNGDVIIIYSDGIVEAENSEGKQFGTTGIVAAVEGVQSRVAKDIRDGVIRACAVFSGREQPDDDQSIVVVQIGNPEEKEPIEDQLVRVSQTQGDKLSLTVLHSGDTGTALERILNDLFSSFAASHGIDDTSIANITTAAREAITNCLRHGTPKGSYLEITFTSLSADEVELELIQPNAWPHWVDKLGRHRSAEVRDRIKALDRGETPMASDLGTQLIVAAASTDIECSSDGRRQRIRFRARVPKKEG